MLLTAHLRSSDSFWGENGRQGRVDHLIFNLWVHKLLQFWILSCNLPLFVRSNLLNILELVTHLPEHETNNSECLRPKYRNLGHIAYDAYFKGLPCDCEERWRFWEDLWLLLLQRFPSMSLQ